MNLSTPTSPFDSLAAVEARLEQIRSSELLGICFQDVQTGQLIQFIDADPDLRFAIEEYYRARIGQLIRSERAAGQVERLLTYPVRKD